MKVIDAFIFYNEFDMLKLRLEYLNDIVDYFIISESNYTHSGKPKPYYLEEVIDQIPEEIRKKIIRLYYEPDISQFDFPKNLTEWTYESGYCKLEGEQRDVIAKNLSQFSSDDLFMLSDVDEIPRKEVIKQFLLNGIKENVCVAARCEMFFYNFTTLGNNTWPGTLFSKVKNFVEYGCEYFRHRRFSLPFIPNAGWHFSYIGSSEFIQNKLESFSHQEYNNLKYKSEENILSSIQNKKSIFNQNEKFVDYKFSDFPPNLQKLITKYFLSEYYSSTTMNTIDIAIPTMWYEEKFTDYLRQYCEYKNLQNIYLIDNQKSRRPQDDILNHPKIKLICYNQNIYVNPAWNEGYYRSKADVIGLFSDDVFVEEGLFDYIANLDMTEIDIVGSYLKGTIDNYHINSGYYEKDELIKISVNKKQPIGGQCYAFGVCMFMKRSSYKPIPSLYKIWFGDDFLVQNCENVYAFKTSKIHGEISKTLVKFDKKSSINKRVELDRSNAYKFGHFQNGQNWDILKPKEQKNIFGY